MLPFDQNISMLNDVHTSKPDHYLRKVKYMSSSQKPVISTEADNIPKKNIFGKTFFSKPFSFAVELSQTVLVYTPKYIPAAASPSQSPFSIPSFLLSCLLFSFHLLSWSFCFLFSIVLLLQVHLWFLFLPFSSLAFTKTLCSWGPNSASTTWATGCLLLYPLHFILPTVPAHSYLKMKVYSTWPTTKTPFLSDLFAAMFPYCDISNLSALLSFLSDLPTFSLSAFSLPAYPHQPSPFQFSISNTDFSQKWNVRCPPPCFLKLHPLHRIKNGLCWNGP